MSKPKIKLKKFLLKLYKKLHQPMSNAPTFIVRYFQLVERCELWISWQYLPIEWNSAIGLYVSLSLKIGLCVENQVRSFCWCTLEELITARALFKPLAMVVILVRELAFNPDTSWKFSSDSHWFLQLILGKMRQLCWKHSTIQNEVRVMLDYPRHVLDRRRFTSIVV